MAEAAKENMIFIDWGTSKAAAFLVNAAGDVLDSRQMDCGIKFVPKGGYPVRYAELTQGWRDTAKFTLLAGMVGSANGWEEAPYIALPASPASIAERLHKMKALPNAYIVGGLSYESPEGLHDVIRGEETQILGLTAEEPGQAFLICLPGTHSKWLTLEGDRIDSFTTVMSGDIFAAVTKDTILAMTLDVPQEPSEAAFVRWAKIAQGPEGVMAHLFKVRGAFLFGQLEKRHMRSAISGVVIGAEIAAMRRLYPCDRPVEIIASGPLGRDYALALKSLGVASRRHESGALSVKGLYLISRYVGA